MSFKLLILGSNSAAFAHRRHHTSQLLNIRDHHFLIDCGEGTQLLLKKYQIRLSRIDHILISHLHGDHYFGLIGLLSTMHLFGRTKDMLLIGPPGLKEIISTQLRYSETSLKFKINFKEFTPDISEIIYDHSKYRVITIPMDHQVPCSGYLFREKPKKRRIKKGMVEKLKISKPEIIALKEGKDISDNHGNIKYENKKLTENPNPSFSYAYCADSKVKPELAEIVKGVDLMYHEATFTNDMKNRATSTYHSTAMQAAEFAKLSKVKKLILGHFSVRYKELDSILEEAQTIFDNSALAIEGTNFIIDEK
ncbi:MAG: ribonuclease Z [Ekhidna sp.]|nr:ribonuclease Z [Ekhidna sp.]